MTRKDVIEEDHDAEEEEDLYTERGIEYCYDDDEITGWEEGFMKGYLSG